MIELAKLPKEYHHRVRLNRDFRSDLQWWRVFLPGWNGVSFMSCRNLNKATPLSTLMRQDLGDLVHGASRGSDGSKVHGHRRSRVPTSQRKSSSPLCSPPRYGDLSGVARQSTFVNVITPLLCTLLHPAEALSRLSCSSCEGYTCLPWKRQEGAAPVLCWPSLTRWKAWILSYSLPSGKELSLRLSVMNHHNRK